MSELQILTCNHCGTDNSIGICPKCKRAFVITTTHIKKGLRDEDAKPLTDVPSQFEIQLCDYCTYKEAGDKIKAVSSGLQQRTCTNCHAEFLSHYNLN